ncbi:hypothetical protein ECDEC4B_1429 [Escherichia coli DEC4B]|nr:hypothetical protein ECDEC4B_1429 [Escherichia coli DEC4B]EHV11613.1 hypothetical protein ECDEC4C_1392 [Escherichia coli DEC4C]
MIFIFFLSNVLRENLHMTTLSEEYLCCQYFLNVIIDFVLL